MPSPTRPRTCVAPQAIRASTMMSEVVWSPWGPPWVGTILKRNFRPRCRSEGRPRSTAVKRRNRQPERQCLQWCFHPPVRSPSVLIAVVLRSSSTLFFRSKCACLSWMTKAVHFYATGLRELPAEFPRSIVERSSPLQARYSRGIRSETHRRSGRIFVGATVDVWSAVLLRF